MKNNLIVFCIIMLACLIVALVVSTGYDPFECQGHRISGFTNGGYVNLCVED